MDTTEAETDTRPVVLAIDDTPANLRLLMELLSPDHVVRVATSGAEGLRLARSEPQPDLILLDVRMPGPDGHEVCRQLKGDVCTRDIPVMFVTGADSQDDEARGIELGAVDYITRPICAPILRARVRTHLRQRRQTRDLQRLAVIDGLTGLRNRRGFDEGLVIEWERCRREREPLALLFLDLDHFKRVNDRHGHAAGDEVLRQVARQVMLAARRPADLAARYGGEELLLLLPDTDLIGAVAVAEPLRQAIQRLRTAHGEAITVSIGVHALWPHQAGHPQQLIQRADQRMYEAKAAGRNRVCPRVPLADQDTATSVIGPGTSASPPPL